MWRKWREACGFGVVRSMSRRARSPDNARAEGFFGTLKCDFFKDRDLTGVPFDEFSRLIGEYIEWYRNDKGTVKILSQIDLTVLGPVLF